MKTQNPAQHTATDEPFPLESIGILSVRADCSEAFCGNRELSLTFAQRRVLLALIRRGGAVVEREDVYLSAFGRALPEGSRAVDIHVGRIRRALGAHAAAVVSVGRVGYRIDRARLIS